MTTSSDDIARAIDHAVLSPVATREELAAGVAIARRFGVATLCVRPHDVAEAARRLSDSGVGVAAVIGFPHGGHPLIVKTAEAEAVFADGATEIDYVINLAHAARGDWSLLRDEARALADVAHGAGARVKAILETAHFDAERVRALAETLADTGIDFLKTSTGFGPGGATVEAVRILREAAAGRAQVKASGGIRTRAHALAFLAEGCTRLGTSSTEAILAGEDGGGDAY